MDTLCRFCGLVHVKCDPTYCYCGESPSAKKGEGFNADCDYYFTQLSGEE